MTKDLSVKLIATASASVFACAVFACSGATPDDLIAPPGTSTFSSDPADAGKSVSPTPTSTGTSPGNPGVDAGQGFLSDSGSPQQVDSGTPVNTTSTYCGTSLSCSGTTPDCCGELPATAGNPFTLTCLPQTSTCNGVPISCRDAASCKGNQICCGDRDPTNGYKSLECSSTCAPGDDITTATQFRMCNPSASTDECTTALGADWQCTPSTALPGFGFCDNGT